MIFEQAEGILDLRSHESYQLGHLEGATWLPWVTLPERLNELPATGKKLPCKLFLVGSKDEVEAASVFLDSKGYAVNGSLVIENDKAMQVWSSHLPGKIVTGKASRQLWSPSELLQEFIRLLSKEGVNAKQMKPRPRALDLGCGGGRDSVSLAKHGWQVLGIDQEARVLKRAKQLAANSGAMVKFKCCDLKKQNCFPESQFDLIMVVRYLNRDLFEKIDSALLKGGYILYQTFVTGVEAFESPKNPNSILKMNELSKVFSEYKIIIDRIDTLPDGRPVASFIAQKQ